MVPVLSVQSRFTDPKSWTADSRLTITSFWAKRRAPREREKVSTRGRASGITDTARAMAKMSSWEISTSPPSMRTLARTTNTNVMTVVFKMNLLMRSTPLTSSLSAWTEDALAEMAASFVLTPVAVTSATALPRTTTAPCRRSCSSPISAPPTPPSADAARLETGMLSPVKVVSSTNRSRDSRTVASAGTMSPDSRLSMSPGTRSSVTTSCSLPSRHTVMVWRRYDLSLSAAALDLYS